MYVVSHLIRLSSCILGSVPDRECEICGVPFTPRRGVDKTCSADCQRAHRRRLNRDRARQQYTVRPPRSDAQCEICQERVPAPRNGPMPRFCKACRADREVSRGKERGAGVRRCHKCETPVPDAAGKPGKTVCASCRIDQRTNRQAYERRRTLRKYGLTQEQYDQLLAGQGGRCPGCGTDEPGAKGWCIDHCHKGGQVRALMCFRCNLVVGQVNEDPVILRALADWLEQQMAQVG